MVNSSGKDKHSKDCMCPWKMYMCHVKSLWMAFVGLFALNFVFLYVIHAAVMHFLPGHAHAHMIFLGTAALLGTAVLIYHKRCMCCGTSCEK